MKKQNPPNKARFWALLAVFLLLSIWLALKIDGLRNVFQLGSEPFHFIGIRGELAKISPILAYLPMTSLVLAVLLILLVVAGRFHLSDLIKKKRHPKAE